MASRNLTVIIAATAILCAPVSCITETLHNTPHPEKAQITVTARWNGRGEGVGIPASWALSIGNGYSAEETDSIHVPDRYFSPGEYGILAWSLSDGVSVADSSATVNAMPQEPDFITGTPEWFFACALDTTVLEDRNYALTAGMRQETRELVMSVVAAGDSYDRITSISGYLTGAAGSMNFVTGAYSDESKVRIEFSRVSSDETSDRWEASARLLGIMPGTSQKFIWEIRFENGNPGTMSLESDITDKMATFNSDKTTPMRLETQLADTPGEGDFTAGLGGWEQVDAGHMDAH